MDILERNNQKICYQTAGVETDPCLMLIMGITGQLVHWPNDLIQGLADSGFYVIIFDNRDVGLSSYYDHLKTPSISEVITQKQQGKMVNSPYSLSDMADDIVILMEGLGIAEAHIAGISMGGQIAQIFAIKHPEKTLTLTLIATSSGDPSLPPAKQAVLSFFFGSKKPVTDLVSAIERHVAQYKIYNHPDDFDIEDTARLQTLAYKRAYHPAGNQRQLLAMVCAEARSEALKKLELPTLIIHGDYDPVFSADHGKQLAECIPNSQLEIISNMGHGIPKRIYSHFTELLRSFVDNSHLCRPHK